MSFSIQTNVNSLIAQENLRVNSNFQSMTIQKLTSGYRINSSGDDAAGLAVANKFRSDVAELSQGVRNANDGISTLQIVDGGINNVSKMLDRLRTLATQSASDTFAGDRSVLNNEFQSLLSEIDRQAQSVGMNRGGQFAKSLGVFIGGGKDAVTGGLSASNGTITMDLRNSAVDTQSLGLKGLQVVAGSTDIGAGSLSSVSLIKANAANTTATAGFTDLYFAGPGFSDGSKVKVSVNLASVTDVDTLAAAINTAVQNVGNGATQAATAFRSANVLVSVNTDASGGKQLAFTSATTAFQLEAGDRMSNAFLGQLSGTTGNATSSTVTGGNTTAAAFTPTGVTLRLSGAGLSSPVDFTFASGSTTTALAITDLTAQVSADSAMAAAGITVSGAAGSPLVFTSARGEKFNVQITGDTSNNLGFGSFVAGAANVADYATVQGAAYAPASAFGSAHLEFSLGGAASTANAINVDLAAGDATAAIVTGTAANPDANSTALTIAIDGAGPTTVTFLVTDTTALLAAARINATVATVTATVDSSGHVIIAANAKGGHSVVIAGAGAITLGVNGTFTGSARSGQSVADALNSGFAADTEMSAGGLNASFSGGKLTVASNNGSFFRLNAGTSAAAASVGFGVAGATFTGSTSSVAANTVLDAHGSTNTGALAFTAMSFGSDDQSITVSAADSVGGIQSRSIMLRNDATARNGRSIDEAISYINAQLQQTNNPTLQKIVAVKEDVAGVEKINFVSALSAFSVSVGTSTNGDGFNGAGVPGSTVEASALGAGANVSINSQTGALAAINALSTAVSTLGTAQAAVGKGQNQLNYAVSLAQSQISSFAAAESRIRDADVAMEAANLTKAQVLQQASIAAMAQANSAPQAVLALLRG